MVGIFSRFSVRAGHRRAQSALEEDREVLQSSLEATTGAASSSALLSAAPHGLELAVEFKPVERPTEPLDNDQPIQCPLPEPSMLNDGRIWKERVSSTSQRRGDMQVIQEEQTTPVEPETIQRKPRPPSNRAILPSVSAPEHNILKLLEECNSSGI